MTKRIVILTASSGGGHNAAAQTLQTLISTRLDGKCEFDLIDIYHQSIFHRLPLLAKIRYNSDALWRFFLALTNHSLISRTTATLMRPLMLRSISKQLPNQCDYLIAVHFNPAQCLSLLSSRFSQPPKTAIVITDFDPHWAWIGPGCDALFTTSPAGRSKALASGYLPQQVFDMAFTPTEQIIYREPITSSAKKFCLGLVSGQDGSNSRQIHELLVALSALPIATKIEITLYCGTNKKLRTQLLEDTRRFAPLQLKVLGYTKNLKAQLHQYDLMLIRISPGILSECICAGVPVVGFEWSAHEQYQQQFIEQHAIGFASKSIAALQQYLVKALTHPQVLIEIHNNGRFELGVNAVGSNSIRTFHK